MGKIIVRVKGGLGNQLFCYAAARRLALVNASELAVDDVTGFARDHRYRRQYSLDHFSIPCRMATSRERMEPFERYRRGIARFWARRLPFSKRSYIEQQGQDFDARLLHFKPVAAVCLDGLWQDEKYFKDVEDVIRSDLRIVPPRDPLNAAMAERIAGCNAVALHVRWFAASDQADRSENAAVAYYLRAIRFMEERVPDAHFFLFSDDPKSARALLPLADEKVTVVSHNDSDEAAFADLWLMSRCRHFIAANSTFSWWGAWLGERAGETLVTAPRMPPAAPEAWDFTRLVPDRWHLL